MEDVSEENSEKCKKNSANSDSTFSQRFDRSNTAGLYYERTMLQRHDSRHIANRFNVLVSCFRRRSSRNHDDDGREQVGAE